MEGPKLLQRQIGKTEREGIRRLREMFHLRKIVKAEINCLRCGRKFRSRDKAANRLCTSCSHSETFKSLSDVRWGTLSEVR